MVKHIHRQTLENGLIVMTENMPHVRSVSLGIWLKTGARRETPQNLGVCHFLEHMLFKGTTTRTAEEIAKMIDALGGNLDAFTTKDTVCFSAVVLDEHLPVALDILADVIQNPAFSEDEVEREKRVILEEIKMTEDTPDDLVLELFLEGLWKDHPLARPTLGTRHSVRKMSRSVLSSYFNQFFVSGNMMVCAAGNVDHEQFVREISQRFERIPRGKIVDRDKAPAPASAVVLRNKKEMEQVHLCLGVPAYPMDHPERYAAFLLNTILGGGVSSRLFLNVRERRGLAYAVFSSIAAYRDAGALVVYSGTSIDTIDEVIHLVLEEFGKLKADKIETDELARAKNHLKGNLMLSLESTSSRMSNLARQELYFRRFFTLDEILKSIERVPVEEVQNVAREIFVADRLVVSVIGPLDGWKLHKKDLAC